MNKVILTPLLVFVFFLSACMQTSVPTSKDSLVGAFQAIEGFSDEFRCYCENAGYLITEEGVSHPVCFRQVQKVSCQYIEVQGKLTHKTIIPPISSSCAAGDMNFFSVSSYRCLDSLNE